MADELPLFEFEQPPQEVENAYADEHATGRGYEIIEVRSYTFPKEAEPIRCAQFYDEQGKMTRLALDGRVLYFNQRGEVTGQHYAESIEDTLNTCLAQCFAEAEQNGSARLENIVLTVTKQDQTE